MGPIEHHSGDFVRYRPLADSLNNIGLLAITTGIAACCARAASGHAAAALPESAMNSRRLMASPVPRTTSGMKRLSHFWIKDCAVGYTQASCRHGSDMQLVSSTA
jgi:hypothetical protein